MTSSQPSLEITDEQFDMFRAVMGFWWTHSQRLGIPFVWGRPRRFPPNAVVIGNGDVGFRIRNVGRGYEIVMTREREGEQPPSFYARYEDAIKRIAHTLGSVFRADARPASSTLTWRDRVAEGVNREDLGDGWARYSLTDDPSVFCVTGSYDGDEFSPALTMSIDEFNHALLDDVGVLPPGLR